MAWYADIAWRTGHIILAPLPCLRQHRLPSRALGLLSTKYLLWVRGRPYVCHSIKRLEFLFQRSWLVAATRVLYCGCGLALCRSAA